MLSVRLSRRLLRCVALSALLSWSAIAGAAQDPVTMDVGWAKTMDSDYAVLVKRFKKLVEKYTDGSVVVKMHCCAQIATEDDAFKALQLGTVDGYIITHNNVAPNWPLMNVFVLPYVFENSAHITTVLDGPIGERVRKKLYGDTGVHLLAYGGIFYRDMYTIDTPVNAMSDLSGLKYRVPKNQVMIDTIDAFGAEPVPLAWSDTPTALQTGTIDASSNGTNTIKDSKFYEFAHNLVILDHFAGFSPLFASDRFMSELDEEQREAVEKAAREAGHYQAEIMAKDTERVRKWLQEKGGMKVYRPNRKPFIEAAKKVQNEYAKNQSPEFRELLSAIRSAAR